MPRLGVGGKAAGRRTQRELADHDPRLNAGRLDALTARAKGQADTLEKLRVQSVANALVA